MTIKQAVSWLSQPGILAMIHDPTTKKAVQVAIKALSATDKNVGTKLSTNLAEVGTDCISRQEAIDAVCMEWCGVKHQDCKHPFDDEEDDYYWCDGCETVLRTLPDLPSAQPEQCEDAVSRQAAIDTEGLDAEIRCEMCKNPMRTDRGCDGHCEYDEKLYEKIMQVLDERIKPLPSAEPEQRTGKWIKLDMHRGMADHKCTACEQECYVPTCMGEPLYAFCPMCGAKMEGADDE